MPYVGNPLADAYSARQKQDLTGQSGTSFTLTHSVSSPNDLSVYINHVRQEPTTAYTVNGTTLTTTGSVAGTDDFYIIYDELAIQSISHPTNQALTATAGTFTSGLVGTTATFSGAVSGTTGTFSGAVSGTTGTFSSTVDIQGQELILDADNDTSIKADTDDQIDFKAGNIIRASVISTGLQVGGTAYFASPTLTLKDPDSGVGAGTVGGKIDFHTMDSTATGVSATIKAKYEDANGNTALVFDTGSGGSTSEKLRVTSAGKVGIGTTSPQDIFHAYEASGQRVARFEANNSTSAHIAFKASNTTYMPAIGVKDEALYLATHDAHERFRIKDNGRILIGDAGTSQSGASLLLGNDNEEGYSISSSSSTQLKKGGKSFILKDGSNHSTDTNIFWSPRSTGWSMFYWNKVNDGGSDNRYVDLYFDGSTKGTIQYNTSTGGINYNTSSDYRLKDNIKDKDINNLYDDIKKLKVRTFKFKKDVDESADDTVGFIAHEVQEVFPHLCEIPKDAMKDNIEGRTPSKIPEYQQLDYGKFTPFIIGALQKAMEKIETLEAKVKALEEA